MTHRQATILTIVGGAPVALGSLLPWITLTTGFGSLSLNGIEGDGVISLVLGGALALLGFLAYDGSRRLGIGTLLLALLTFGFGAYELTRISGRAAEQSSDAARASVGIGLYLVVGGALIALVASVMRWRGRSSVE